jgi:tetratricopeptide (TPR) repeat protein
MLIYKFASALRQLEKCDTGRVDVLLRIGQCNSRLGVTNEAIRPLKRVLELDSTNVSALNLLGQVYLRNGEYLSAFESYVLLTYQDSTNGFYYKQAGMMAVRLEDVHSARTFFSHALNYNPGDIESSLALGNLLMDLEEYDAVDSVARLALALAPTSKPILILQARANLERQQYEAVVTTMNTLVQQSDTTVLYARLLGESYLYMHKYEELKRCMLFLFMNRVQDERMFYCMAVALRETGDERAAIPWFERAAKTSISGNTSVYFSNLGQCYEAIKKYPEAIKAYRMAYNYSSDPIMLYHLGRNYDMYYRKKDMALDHYKRYLASTDTTRVAREYVRRRLQDLGVY